MGIPHVLRNIVEDFKNPENLIKTNAVHGINFIIYLYKNEEYENKDKLIDIFKKVLKKYSDSRIINSILECDELRSNPELKDLLIQKILINTKNNYLLEYLKSFELEDIIKIIFKKKYKNFDFTYFNTSYKLIKKIIDDEEIFDRFYNQIKKYQLTKFINSLKRDGLKIINKYNNIKLKTEIFTHIALQRFSNFSSINFVNQVGIDIKLYRNIIDNIKDIISVDKHLYLEYIYYYHIIKEDEEKKIKIKNKIKYLLDTYVKIKINVSSNSVIKKFLEDDNDIFTEKEIQIYKATLNGLNNELKVLYDLFLKYNLKKIMPNKIEFYNIQNDRIVVKYLIEYYKDNYNYLFNELNEIYYSMLINEECVSYINLIRKIYIYLFEKIEYSTNIKDISDIDEDNIINFLIIKYNEASYSIPQKYNIKFFNKIINIDEYYLLINKVISNKFFKYNIKSYNKNNFKYLNLIMHHFNFEKYNYILDFNKINLNCEDLSNEPCYKNKMFIHFFIGWKNFKLYKVSELDLQYNDSYLVIHIIDIFKNRDSNTYVYIFDKLKDLFNPWSSTIFKIIKELINENYYKIMETNKIIDIISSILETIALNINLENNNLMEKIVDNIFSDQSFYNKGIKNNKKFINALKVLLNKLIKCYQGNDFPIYKIKSLNNQINYLYEYDDLKKLCRKLILVIINNNLDCMGEFKNLIYKMLSEDDLTEFILSCNN